MSEDSELVARAALALFEFTPKEWSEKSEYFRKAATKDVRRMIVEVQRWRPIAEAPKDEKPILAYWGPIQEGAARCMDIAVWHEGSWVDPDDIGVRYGPPTHWQPLPAPPKQVDYDDGDHGRPDAH